MEANSPLPVFRRLLTPASKRQWIGCLCWHQRPKEDVALGHDDIMVTSWFWRFWHFYLFSFSAKPCLLSRFVTDTCPFLPFSIIFAIYKNGLFDSRRAWQWCNTIYLLFRANPLPQRRNKRTRRKDKDMQEVEVEERAQKGGFKKSKERLFPAKIHSR